MVRDPGPDRGLANEENEDESALTGGAKRRPSDRGIVYFEGGSPRALLGGGRATRGVAGAYNRRVRFSFPVGLVNRVRIIAG